MSVVAAALVLQLLLLLGSSSAAAARAAVDCTATPRDAACAAFKLPAATALSDIAAVCKAIPQLSGCSLSKACAANKAAAAGAAAATVCDPFSQLATVCSDPLGKTAPQCKRYSALCGPGSAVRQCKESAPLPLVGAVESNKQVRSICEEMDMEGCELCTLAWKQGKLWGGPSCDPFAVYGWLCVQMPDMHQCIGADRWSAMCKRLPGLYACTAASERATKGWAGAGRR